MTGTLFSLFAGNYWQNETHLIGAFFVLFGIAAGLFAVWFFLRRVRRFSAEVTAYVTEVLQKDDYVENSRGEREGVVLYSPVFVYDFNGTQYRVQDPVWSQTIRHAAGTTAVLHVDPWNPESFMEQKKEMWAVIFAVVITFLLLIAGIVMMLN